MSTLSIIATPIGNLEDITLRALKALAAADVILCEDTRITKRLLDRHSIKTRALSYHAHSQLSRVDEIIALLKEGKNLALVSDAGTPGISDPGAELVARIRRELSIEISAGTIKIEAVPGPSALTAALSIAGVPCADFTFLGFLPHKKGRETLFKEIAASERTMVFYESPHRIIKTLDSLGKTFKFHLSQTWQASHDLSRIDQDL
jgi:16S rRNA (cytidine1402-2'-O)-methyltransferase